MCMAIPSRIVALDGDNATVECFGVRRVVSLMLMPEPVSLGDYVIVQSNAFAMDKVPEADALESLRYLQTVLTEAEVESA